ncbi:hypothetical protein CRG98_048531 [Punica granatum]|uniref:Uncharacterized protein n=1 Tax=Punica granatum TaxID=22663 RepID=A0A2I0HHC3_PUNGR|nr:hypothetical protein CRG98_048531 [Punica granatum]
MGNDLRRLNRQWEGERMTGESSVGAREAAEFHVGGGEVREGEVLVGDEGGLGGR